MKQQKDYKSQCQTNRQRELKWRSCFWQTINKSPVDQTQQTTDTHTHSTKTHTHICNRKKHSSKTVKRHGGGGWGGWNVGSENLRNVMMDLSSSVVSWMFAGNASPPDVYGRKKRDRGRFPLRSSPGCYGFLWQWWREQMRSRDEERKREGGGGRQKSLICCMQSYYLLS